jgi:hypothetical protein
MTETAPRRKRSRLRLSRSAYRVPAAQPIHVIGPGGPNGSGCVMAEYHANQEHLDHRGPRPARQRHTRGRCRGILTDVQREVQAETVFRRRRRGGAPSLPHRAKNGLCGAPATREKGRWWLGLLQVGGPTVALLHRLRGNAQDLAQLGPRGSRRPRRANLPIPPTNHRPLQLNRTLHTLQRIPPVVAPRSPSHHRSRIRHDRCSRRFLSLTRRPIDHPAPHHDSQPTLSTEVEPHVTDLRVSVARPVMAHVTSP